MIEENNAHLIKKTNTCNIKNCREKIAYSITDMLGKDWYICTLHLDDLLHQIYAYLPDNAKTNANKKTFNNIFFLFAITKFQICCYVIIKCNQEKICLEFTQNEEFFGNCVDNYLNLLRKEFNDNFLNINNNNPIYEDVSRFFTHNREKITKEKYKKVYFSFYPYLENEYYYSVKKFSRYHNNI